MQNNPAVGVGHLLEGLRLLNQSGLRRFVLIPLLVNIVIFSLLIWLGVGQFEALLEWLLPEDSWWQFLSWLLWPLFAITLVLVVFFSFTVLANLIAAPFNGLLAEKVEMHLGGEIPSEDTDWKALIADIVPSILVELRKLSYFLLRAVPLLILFLIPGVNLAAPVLWFLFNAWYMALEYGDFPMANHGLKFTDQLPKMRKLRFTAIGFGSGLTLLMLVPVLNFLAMPAAVAGATALWVKEIKPGTGS